MRKLEIQKANVKLVEKMIQIKKMVGEYNPRAQLPPHPHSG